MMTLGLKTLGPVEPAGVVPPFGRWGFQDEGGIGAALWSEVPARVPGADYETTLRVADAVSLRGADLVGGLLARFHDVDEALAALEDYAGAFDSLAIFAAEVHAERYSQARDLSEADAGAMGRAMVLRGEVSILRLGADLHIFWKV